MGGGGGGGTSLRKAANSAKWARKIQRKKKPAKEGEALWEEALREYSPASPATLMVPCLLEVSCLIEESEQGDR